MAFLATIGVIQVVAGPVMKKNTIGLHFCTQPLLGGLVQGMEIQLVPTSQGTNEFSNDLLCRGKKVIYLPTEPGMQRSWKPLTGLLPLFTRELDELKRVRICVQWCWQKLKKSAVIHGSSYPTTNCVNLQGAAGLLPFPCESDTVGSKAHWEVWGVAGP